jgi:hypothetical protein
MNTPTPSLLPDGPLELLDAQTLFATGAPRRRMAGGLARLPSGRLLLTFAFGPMPRRNDGAVMRSWSDDGGRTWAEPLPLLAAPGWDCYPMARAGAIADDHLRLFVGRVRFTPALGGKQPFAAWRASYLDSRDGGETWSDLAPDLALYPAWTEVYGASNPHRLAGGRLMWAASGTLGRDQDWRFGVSFTDAAGEKFTPPVVIAAGPDQGFCEGDVVRLDDGRFLAVVREQLAQVAVTSSSDDDGRTWSPLRPTGFKGANIKLFRLRSGAILCAYRDEDPARRGVGCSLSEDGGETWCWLGHLYAAPPEAEHVPGHLCGYPDLVATGNREVIAVLHTYADRDGEMTLHVLRLRDVS